MGRPKVSGSGSDTLFSSRTISTPEAPTFPTATPDCEPLRRNPLPHLIKIYISKGDRALFLVACSQTHALQMAVSEVPPGLEPVSSVKVVATRGDKTWLPYAGRALFTNIVPVDEREGKVTSPLPELCSA